MGLAVARQFHYIGSAMLKKALMPILLITVLIVTLVVIDYGCMRTGFEEKILGPEEED